MNSHGGRRVAGLGMTLTALWLLLAATLAASASDPDVPGNWYTGGRDKDGTYFSPLTQINADNVDKLGFAWSYDLGEPMRGQEATPIVIDGA